MVVTNGPIIVVALLVIFGILLNLITVPLGTFVIRHPKKTMTMVLPFSSQVSARLSIKIFYGELLRMIRISN